MFKLWHKHKQGNYCRVMEYALFCLLVVTCFLQALFHDWVPFFLWAKWDKIKVFECIPKLHTYKKINEYYWWVPDKLLRVVENKCLLYKATNQTKYQGLYKSEARAVLTAWFCFYGWLFLFIEIIGFLAGIQRKKRAKNCLQSDDDKCSHQEGKALQEGLLLLSWSQSC